MENANLFESKKVDYNHKKSFVTSIAIKKSEYYLLKLVVMSQLEKWQNNRFYNYYQRQISFKLQTAFVAKTHQQNLLPKLDNYQRLKGHLFEKQFCKNMKEHMRKQCIQFRSCKIVNIHKAKIYQILSYYWVFKYKTDKHSCLQKCKARLIICEINRNTMINQLGLQP